MIGEIKRRTDPVHGIDAQQAPAHELEALEGRFEAARDDHDEAADDKEDMDTHGPERKHIRLVAEKQIRTGLGEGGMGMEEDNKERSKSAEELDRVERAGCGFHDSSSGSDHF
jgi:hypothetical protein